MTPSQLQSAVVASALATSAALAEENVVYWVSAPVQPGETVMMCGFFPQHDGVEIAVERLADGDPGEACRAAVAALQAREMPVSR